MFSCCAHSNTSSKNVVDRNAPLNPFDFFTFNPKTKPFLHVSKWNVAILKQTVIIFELKTPDMPANERKTVHTKWFSVYTLNSKSQTTAARAMKANENKKNTHTKRCRRNEKHIDLFLLCLFHSCWLFVSFLKKGIRLEVHSNGFSLISRASTLTWCRFKRFGYDFSKP